MMLEMLEVRLRCVCVLVTLAGEVVAERLIGPEIIRAFMAREVSG